MLKKLPTDPRPFVGIKHRKRVHKQTACITSQQGVFRCSEMVTDPAKQQCEERKPQAPCRLVVKDLTATGQDDGDHRNEIRMPGLAC